MNLRNKKGIYKIFNIITGEFYIGSATLTFKKRETQHISDLKKNKHRNIHLQRSYNKHGWEKFFFTIIEVIEDESQIIPREQWYIDNFKPEYNIAKIAECSAKGRKRTPEQIEALRQINLGRPSWNRGLKFSEESKMAMSLAKRGKKRRPTQIKLDRDKPILRSDGLEFKNPEHAATELGVKPNTIVKAITDKDRIRKVKGYTFKYIPQKLPDMFGIRPNKTGYVVVLSRQYLGYYGTLDEAKQVRDKYIDKDNGE